VVPGGLAVAKARERQADGLMRQINSLTTQKQEQNENLIKGNNALKAEIAGSKTLCAYSREERGA
jgi:hypothetical protein